MDTFFQIIGILTVALLVLVVLVGLFAWWKWRKLKSLLAMSMDAIKMEITPDMSARWMTFDKAQAYEKEVIGLGFEKVNSYHTSAGIDLTCYVHRDLTYCAAISNTAGEIHVEFTCYDEVEEKTIDVSDSKMLAALTPSKYKVSIARPEFSVPDLYALFTKIVEGRQLQRWPVDDFARLLQESVNRDMTQLYEGGGLEDIDIEKIMDAYGEGMSDSEKAEFIEEHKMEHMRMSWEVCLDTLEESDAITPREWNKYEGTMIATRESYDVGLFSKLVFAELIMDDDGDLFNDEETSDIDVKEVMLQVEGAKTCDEFMQLLMGAVPNYKIVLLAELEEPKCKVYGYEDGYGY